MRRAFYVIACCCAAAAGASTPREDAKTPREDEPAAARPPTPLEIIVAGTLGSMVGELASFPCDVLKTEVLSSGAGVVAAATALARTRGPLGIFAGVTAPLVGAFLARQYGRAASRGREHCQ